MSRQNEAAERHAQHLASPRKHSSWLGRVQCPAHLYFLALLVSLAARSFSRSRLPSSSPTCLIQRVWKGEL